ncbi:hypothetical protein DFQ13_11682 [Actinokineospora spheciospongiae]|nr:hypothetical protein DFQ13_11682 [Actinokineospora spheciospongiae]
MTPPAPAPMTVDEVLVYLGGCGFAATPSRRVHQHHASGARVVITDARAGDITIHAYGGAWKARLTRAPVAVVTATITAALAERPTR